MHVGEIDKTEREKAYIFCDEILHPLTMGQESWDVVEHQGLTSDGSLWLGQPEFWNMLWYREVIL